VIGCLNTEPPNELIANQSDPDTRMVLEDWRLSNGERVTRLGVALWMRQADDAADAADAAADDAADAADAAAAADAADAAAAADAADADDADDADADAAAFLQILIGDIDMRDGLKVIQIPGYYSGYAATLVGYLRRVAGDEYELLPGARAVYRVGSRRGLSWLAANGPGEDYRLKDPSATPEQIHRLVIRRCIEANVPAWAEYVVMPRI